MIATRKASNDIIQWAAAQVPELVGGSADLAPSTLTLIDGGGDVERGAYDGRNLHFGIREHGMGAIVNGLVLHGLRAFGAGFLIFSDYMKGSIRLAAVMRIPSIFVFTHDSIGLGEDGPTHQPIEQLATLRATPNLNVVRPAGFNETAQAWHFALTQTDTPTVLALSRQGLPVWDPAGVPADAIERGAYVLHDAEDPDLILMGSGSEVHVADDARKLLEADGLRVRLVSMPCLDRFAEQDAGLPRQRAAAVGARPRGGRGGEPARLAPLGRRPRRRRRDGGLRRLRAGEAALRALRLHGGGGRRARASGGGSGRARVGPTGGIEMSATEVNERLAALTAAGTSVWLDQIRRSMIESGELQRMVEEDSLRGVTSNPAIFEKAILGSPDYDAELESLAREGLSAREVYRRMAVRDVQLACDVLRPVFDESGGEDGYVSLEVAPRLAHDTEGTLEQARQYWGLVDRPNVMIKIPATDAGIPAIEEALYEGLNVNVTLLFAVSAYERVMEAFVRAMERRHEEGKPLDRHSVASFFVSRVDSEVDKRLEALGRSDLAGRAGLANARAAYLAFQRVFEGERFAALREAGCPVQRPLWASTGVKNPQYPETLYVYGLVGPHTVNTMPLPTLLASRADGRGHRRDGRRGPAGRPRRAARGGHRPRRRHRQAAARRHRGLHGPDGQAARRHRAQARGDRHRPPGRDRGRPARRARAAARRARASAPPRRTSRAASGSTTARCGRPRARPRSPTASAG